MKILRVLIAITNFLFSLSQAVDLTGLKVSGNTIVNGKGQKVLLRGVNKSGTEFACIQGYGFYDGTDLPTIIAAILSWKANIVRIPLNEQCWLNINVKPAYGGSNYITAVDTLVQLILKNGMAVILDLHWTSSTSVANKQEPMPNTVNSVNFWKQVATKYGSEQRIIFDLFNEPYPDNNQDTTAAWTCLLNGGTCQGISYQVAGMQSLVTAIRSVNAKNILMIGGVEYANALTNWMQYAPKDPLNNIVPSWHSYNFNLCNTQACWDKVIGPITQKYPIIVGEIGENDCSYGYINSLMVWLDSKAANYLAWTFNAWDCHSGPALVDSNWNPTGFGAGYKSHLANETHKCDTTKSLSVTFPSANEWWLQMSFSQTLGQMSNAQVVFGSNTFTLSTSSWSSYDFTLSTNGVQIVTGTTVTVRASILNIVYSSQVQWLKVSSATLHCVSQEAEINKNLKCNSNKNIGAKLAYESSNLIKATFFKELGKVKNVSIKNGEELTKLKQTFWSDFKFQSEISGVRLEDKHFEFQAEIDEVEYRGIFNWKDSSVKLFC